MRWTYDQDVSALYIYLSDQRPTSQVKMPDGVVVDVDDAGNAVGIEVLGAAADWDRPAVVQRFGLSHREAATLERIAGQVARHGVPTSNTSESHVRVA